MDGARRRSAMCMLHGGPALRRGPGTGRHPAGRPAASRGRCRPPAAGRAPWRLRRRRAHAENGAALTCDACCPRLGPGSARCFALHCDWRAGLRVRHVPLQRSLLCRAARAPRLLGGPVSTLWPPSGSAAAFLGRPAAHSCRAGPALPPEWHYYIATGGAWHGCRNVRLPRADRRGRVGRAKSRGG